MRVDQPDAHPPNADKRGTYRWCNNYRLPEYLGGGIVTVRLHANAEDKKCKFNRAENIRQIAPGDPDFELLYRRRNDAESINRHFDDTLWLRRAHSVGNRWQLLSMMTYALGGNTLSMHVRRQGLAHPGRLRLAYVGSTVDTFALREREWGSWAYSLTNQGRRTR